MNATLQKFKQYLLTGVSYVVPFIACGGILIALSIAFAPMTPNGPDFSNSPRLKLINEIGVAAFSLSLPVLAGFIAYGMASRPGLVPGMIGGYLANEVKAGFLGAIVAGLAAGYIVNLLKNLPVHRVLKPVMPIIVIPIVAGSLVGVMMLGLIGHPIAEFMDYLAGWLRSLNQSNAILLGAILGAMIAFDMGGPVNKAAFFFGAAMLKEGNFAVMGACAAAICTPPLGLGLATLLNRRRWTEEQWESGLAALGMGMIGITEGAIPFAAADPLRVIPCIMVGSMIAAVIAMLGGVGDHAPHGGPIVFLVVDHRAAYAVAIATGTVATALAINSLKQLTEKTRETPVAAP
jgi:fructose-specific phosphotransferase system IIC component